MSLAALLLSLHHIEALYRGDCGGQRAPKAVPGEAECELTARTAVAIYLYNRKSKGRPLATGTRDIGQG